MNCKTKSLRTFVGAKNYEESREFYTELGFAESVIDPKMSFFRINEHQGFYLQDYYVEEWIANSMLFLEVDDLDDCVGELTGKDFPARYKQVKITEIKQFDWGRECFMVDPSGVLWHFGEFKR